MNKILGIFAAFAVSAAVVLPAAAEPATLLGVFGNWSAFSSGAGAGLTCYALSTPRATRPAAAKRGSIYLMISDWPGRKVKDEPQVIYGYQAKEGGQAGLGVGGDRFPFFVRNSGKEGSSWLQALNDNPKLIEAMKGGVSVVAVGTSMRGTKTVDTYSLQGFNDALAKIHTVCNM